MTRKPPPKCRRPRTRRSSSLSLPLKGGGSRKGSNFSNPNVITNLIDSRSDLPFSRGGRSSNEKGRPTGPPFQFCQPRILRRLLSQKVVAVEIHHLGPGRHKVLHELLFGVRAAIDFRKGA